MLIALFLMFYLLGGCTDRVSTTSPIEEISIHSAWEWNTFARDFNDGKHEFTDTLIVIIDGRLDFTNQEFVPLGRPFNGSIQGSIEVEGYTENAIIRQSINPGEYGGAYGFYNITSIEKINVSPTYFFSAMDGFGYTFDESREGEPNLEDYVQGGMEYSGSPNVVLGSLFGIRCKELVLENLVFYNISSDDIWYILANSVDTLTMRNIEVLNCSPPQTTALLAGNVGRVQVENLLTSHCSTTLDTVGGGLFTWVYENAAFSRIGFLHTNIILVPDSGGSGYSAGATALLASRVGGDASFNQIEVSNCSLYSLNSVVLCHRYRNLSELSDIIVRNSSFLGFPIGEGDLTGIRDNVMLFGGRTPPMGHSILLQNSMFNTYGQFEDYTVLGYTIDNCTDVEIDAG